VGLREGGRIIRTTLVKGVTGAVLEVVRTYNLRESSKYAEPLYPLQESYIRQ
jgi:hypothetical protein